MLMKYKVLSMMGVLALSAGAWVHAQDFDDIYYDGSSTTSTVKEDAKTAVVVRTPRRATTQLLAADYDVPARYKVSVEKNYKTERDVDEYNRRTGEYAYDAYADTLHGSNESQYTFSNTKRIERFYNPDVVVASSDADLIELYYDETPAQINITFGTSYPGWTTWYDPWYYHNTLWGLGYYDPWFWPYGYRYTWYGWHGPWYYSSWSWGWGRPYWGWSRPYWGWSRPYWGGWYGHHYRHDRPFGGGHHYGSGRPGYAYGGGSMGGRRPNSGRGTGSHVGGSGRKQPGGGGRMGTSMGSRRPGYATGSVGNVGTRGAARSTQGITRSYSGSRPSSMGSSRPGYATGSVGTRSSSSSSRGYASPSRSYSPSHSSSGSRSYGGGGFSGGGGTRGGGGGGFSGGGGRRR